MSKIKQITAREILDSRGNPTVETKVVLNNGIQAKASVPSGASTGVHEAVELRDTRSKRYNGKGVLTAVNNVNEIIAKALIKKDVTQQEKLDQTMLDLDGTNNKKKLGANAILSVSLACARAGALASKQELYKYINKTFKFKCSDFSLPTPSFNIINGGVHADNNLDFQEFMILPVGSHSFKEKIRIGAEIFHELGRALKKAGLGTNVGDEGGYSPNISSSIEAIEFIMTATMKAGYTPGADIGLGLDAGSSEFYNKKTKQYVFRLDQAHFTSTNMIGLYNEWLKKYPFVSIEDGLAEDDWKGWQEWTRELGDELTIIGDDLFTTNVDRLRKGIEKSAANSILIKPNQVGTLTETIQTIKLAQANDYTIMMSHRSGETCDDFIADLAVAVNADYIKTGSLSRGERLAKYNRLMEIEDELEK